MLAILSLPAAVLGYFLSAALLSSLPLPGGLAELVVLFVPVLIAGLCMVPFIIPIVDRQAKRDLEAHRASMAAEEGTTPKDTPKP